MERDADVVETKENVAWEASTAIHMVTVHIQAVSAKYQRQNTRTK